jgi:tetratricopeptide (TPR) repeat protein
MTVDSTNLPLLISGCSFALSIFALVLTYRQKEKQDKLAARKSLTDTVAALVASNIEMERLPFDYSDASRIVSIRRNLNAQRRYLANHGEILIQEIPGLVNDIDHTLVAQAFDASGDVEKARAHWRSSVSKSPTALLRAMNLRGYARFEFVQGNSEAARELFADALKALEGDTDKFRRERADTFLLWAIAERNFGFLEEASRRVQQARAEADRIGSRPNKEDMLRYIDSIWKTEASKT